jgi:hypothetical protein
MSSQKYRSFAFIFLCLFLATPTLFAQAPAATTPDVGRVEGNKYTSAYFGFTYRIPEGWVVRGTGGKAPGVGGNLLLTMKRASGDALSSVMVTATELPTEYRNDVSRYLADRYRVNQAASSGVKINGWSLGRSSNKGNDPELVNVAERSYYRVEIGSASVSRTVMATLEKGYVLIFEIVSPARNADQAARELVDSMYAVTFGTATAGPKPETAQKSIIK